MAHCTRQEVVVVLRTGMYSIIDGGLKIAEF